MDDSYGMVTYRPIHGVAGGGVELDSRTVYAGSIR